jgi:predicted component of type VI protein secretion system
MSYLIVTFNNQEVDRVALGKETIVGRAPDCQLTVRDIQLSRHHCKIEKTLDGYLLQDLDSRNGTFLNGQSTPRRLLKDGDLVRAGRTRIVYRSGTLKLPTHGIARPGNASRAADPHEALAGTVSAFVLEGQEDEAPPPVPAGKLYPRPRPAAPESYHQDEVYSMLDQIMSSSWDSILSENKRPVVMERQRPRPMARPSRPVPRGQRCPVDMSLQAHPEEALARPAENMPKPPRHPRRAMWVAAVVIWGGAAVALLTGYPYW